MLIFAFVILCLISALSFRYVKGKWRGPIYFTLVIATVMLGDELLMLHHSKDESIVYGCYEGSRDRGRETRNVIFNTYRGEEAYYINLYQKINTRTLEKGSCGLLFYFEHLGTYRIVDFIPNKGEEIKHKQTKRY